MHQVLPTALTLDPGPLTLNPIALVVQKTQCL
jgi:hypothetical protein